MKSEKGIWKISQGKGNRYYIECLDKSRVMHPEDLCGMNGLGVYDYKNLQDLAIAILRFEKQKQEIESIIGNLDEKL